MTDRIPSQTPEGASVIPLLVRGSGWLLKSRLLAVLVLAASLVVTCQLWRSSERHALSEMELDFDFRAREATSRIEQRMAVHEQILHSVEGFMSHAKRINRNEFRHFVEKLRLDEKYPGIQGLAFVQIVPAAEKQQHIASIRSEGFPAYSIHPAGVRNTYTAAIYIEPFSAMNQRAFGHDPYSQPVRRAAMDQARDLGSAVITDKVMLVQENDKSGQAGFMMYQPIFEFGAPHRNSAERRASIIGWVSAPFRMNDLMNGLQNEHAPKLSIEIFDGEKISTASLMYDSDPERGANKPGTRSFSALKRIKIANHTWTVQIHSLPAFDAGLDRSPARLLATTGIGISLLLTLLTLVLTNGRERALQAAREMRRLSDHQETIKEHERKRIALDIHDDLGQNLLALKMDAAALHARTMQAHPKLNKRVSIVLANIDSTIQSVKSIINDLRPATLELGLYPAVEWQFKQFERISGIACKLTTIGREAEFGLDEVQTTAVFRILQESLANIARHSGATVVEIELSGGERGFSMKVADNGIGLQPGDRTKANSFGLIGIGERIHALGGSLTITSGPENGTALLISIPVQHCRGIGGDILAAA